ncbi:hypothetical protein Nepgr_008128 [Nepenthes gracilis]|uniref:Uncharacterized protein n=1 Tax=Nepenthes gracilis TaxID=150966 RepID=A0AAD3S843_NEPGR|nr:hypothetical protein Nepgr_008128 [Nepenthes gracilis]
MYGAVAGLQLIGNQSSAVGLAVGRVGPPPGGGDSSLERASPSPDGGRLASAIPGAGSWGALLSSCDGGELYVADVEAHGVEVGGIRARAPMWVEISPEIALEIYWL